MLICRTLLLLLSKWMFPDNATIAPNSYLIVWADNHTTQAGLHANFKLSATGEQVVLSYANGTIIDNVTFGVQAMDVSYQRCPKRNKIVILQQQLQRIIL